MLLHTNRSTSRSASSSRISSDCAGSIRLSPDFLPMITPSKMSLHLNRGSLSNNSSFRTPKPRIQRKASTTCVPEIRIPKDQQRRVTVLGAGMFTQA